MNTGDGLLAEFGSVVDAVRCAVDVQRGMVHRNTEVPEERRIEFRIGINVGDVIIERGDIFGDGVNIAARLEDIAAPGGICVSEDTYRQVRGKLELTTEDIGEHKLKNIAQTVRVYRVRPSTAAATARRTLPLPDKPSIAVLPFQNMSGDPEQDYFSDGVVDDIITALSRFRNLFVIARTSSFIYKGRMVDVKQIGRELGVRYVLEGSVRKAANRVRITGQLIDTSTGAHLWADRFEGELEDIFDLQDRVTANVIGAIAPRLQRAEIERAKRKPTENLDAYDHYLRGLASAGRWTRDANSEALRLFYRAIELDSHLALAHGMAAWCYVRRKANAWMDHREQEITEARRLARRAVRLGSDDAVSLSMGGYALAFIGDEFDSAAAFMDRALMVNPNLAMAWNLSGWLRVWRGEPELALEHVAHAMRLSPLDPSMSFMQGAVAFAHFLAGRYEEASSWAEKALRERPNLLLVLVPAAASGALAGHLKTAQKAAESLRTLNPSLRLSNIENLISFRRPEDLARLREGLRKAGLPE
ncbi:MAG TPA: adenylate/guanylate cyclase domain-containing protein [Xanthobacteraceae bacterium]